MRTLPPHHLRLLNDGTLFCARAYDGIMTKTLAVVRLNRIKENAIEIINRAEGTPLYAVVKDDAYGHGAAAVAAALSGIASAFCVSTVEEGVALRLAGIGEKILVFTPPLTQEEAVRAAWYALTPSVTSLSSLNLLLRAGYKGEAELKLDTGMNRYGLTGRSLTAALHLLRESEITVTGAYSHLYAPEDAEATRIQRKRFVALTEAVKAVYPEVTLHLAATGGILAGRENFFDAVRSGIALYGYLPNGFAGRANVKPAMKTYAAVAASRRFSGGGVGYARADKEYGALTTLRVGYGDGYFRSGKEGVLGKLCMDAAVTEGRGKFATRRLLTGNAEEYAREAGTTAYEALLRMGANAEKRYV